MVSFFLKKKKRYCPRIIQYPMYVDTDQIKLSIMSHNGGTYTLHTLCVFTLKQVNWEQWIVSFRAICRLSQWQQLKVLFWSKLKVCFLPFWNQGLLFKSFNYKGSHCHHWELNASFNNQEFDRCSNSSIVPTSSHLKAASCFVKQLFFGTTDRVQPGQKHYICIYIYIFVFLHSDLDVSPVQDASLSSPVYRLDP